MNKHIAICSEKRTVAGKGLDLLSQGLDLLTQGLDLLTQGIDLLTQCPGITDGSAFIKVHSQ
jgi:hypothetical protein